MAGNWRKECLWKALLALGFTPTDDEQRTANRTVFGVDMFDKPNVEAFQIVVYYLFMQLDQTRVNIVFSLLYCHVGVGMGNGIKMPGHREILAVYSG